MTLSAPGAAALTSPVIRQALVPMAVFYLILMLALGLGLLRLHRDRPGRAAEPERRLASGGTRPRGRVALARQVLTTVVCGYLLLMVVVTAYYYGIARVGGDFLGSAFTGFALLIGLSMPVFALASWLYERVRGHAEPAGGVTAGQHRR